MFIVWRDFSMNCIRPLIIAICWLAASCTPVPQTDDSTVANLVQNRIDKRVHWNQATFEDTQVQTCIELLLKQEQTEESLVQIALLNNPQIQAHFENLGIAQADLVQAGLLQNPIFAAMLRLPSQNSYSTNVEFSVTQSFLDVFLIPLRKKIAVTELEQAQFRVASLIISLAFDVEETYYNLQAEQIKVQLLVELVEAKEASVLLAKSQYDSGNSNDLEFQGFAHAYLLAKLDLFISQACLASLREKMNTLLGLSSTFVISNKLSKPPQEELVKESIERFAIDHRLDVSLARLEIKRICQMMGLKQWWAYTDLSLGISGERDLEGEKALGPTAVVSLPLFNHGQADRARLHAKLKASQKQLQALNIEVLAEVRRQLELLTINKSRVELYSNELLPLQQNIVSCSQKYYNVMGLSVYTLLQNKQNEVKTQIAYTEALRDYWVAKLGLYRAVGGKISL